MICPRFACNFPPLQREGAGNAGRPMRPRARVQMILGTRVSQVTPEITRHSPRNGFTVSFVLSPVTGLFCHRHRRNCLHRLDTSVGVSGPHDFAVRLKRRSSIAPSASTASRRASDDDAQRPSCGRDQRYRLICVEKQKYFCEGAGQTNIVRPPVGQITLLYGRSLIG